MKINHCALIALVALAPTAAWGTAKIAVSPNANHPTGKIVVNGSGFQANEPIDVRWDGKKLLFTVNSNANGAFPNQKAKVPKSALPGAHTLNGKGANGDSAKVAFTVTTPWLGHGFMPAGTRDNAYENLISANNVGNLVSAWTVTTGN